MRAADAGVPKWKQCDEPVHSTERKAKLHAPVAPLIHAVSHFFTHADVTAPARGGRIVPNGLMESGVRSNAAIVGIVAAAIVIAGIGYYSGRKTGLREAREDPTTAASTTGAVRTPVANAQAVVNSTSPTPAASHPRKMLNSAASSGSATAAPLPAPGTPLTQIFDELKARADAGDADAATRLYEDLQHCAAAQRLGASLPFAANRALNSSMPTSSAELERSDRQLDRVQRGLDFQQSSAEMCAGLTPNQMAALVPQTLAAAQLGDAQAADCYVGANLNAWPDLLNNPGWIDDYKNNALPLANDAVQLGNWAMVGLLAAANAGGPRNNNMLNQLTGTNPLQAYTYAKLMSLGQPPDTTPSNRSTNALSTLASQLTPEQIQSADAQAQSMYQQYFNATPRQTGQVMDAMRNCQAEF